LFWRFASVLGRLLLAFFKVPADVAALEQAAVQRDRFDPAADQFALLRPQSGLIEHRMKTSGSGQEFESAVQRVVIGSAGQADVSQPVGAVDQQGLDAAIAFLLMFADDQAGE
jgi:hypothetical protein